MTNVLPFERRLLVGLNTRLIYTIPWVIGTACYARFAWTEIGLCFRPMPYRQLFRMLTDRKTSKNCD